MVGASEAVKTKGLRDVRRENTGIVARTEGLIQVLLEKVGWDNS
jgi:hypothetical protein